MPDIRPTPATRRALLVTCSLGTLPGAEHSVDAMARFLGGRGFACHVLRDVDATRQGVTQALARLANDTVAGDAVVVYYAGHGYAVDIAGGHGYHFVLATADLHDSTEGDFRGLLDVEFHKHLKGVAARTHNVTVILDCCHAAAVVPGPARETSSAALAAMRAALGRRVRKITRDGDNIVYVVSAAHPEIANETTDRDGRPIYAFTEQLVRTLEQLAGIPVNWDEVVFAAAAQLRDDDAIQRPGVGGRRQREVFEARDLETPGWLGVMLDERTIRLRAGRAMTLAIGDRLLVAPLGPGEHPAEVAAVEHVEPLHALLTRSPGTIPDPPVVRAVRLCRGARAVLGAVGQLDPALKTALAARSVDVLPGTPAEALATLWRAGDEWTLRAGDEVLGQWSAGSTDFVSDLLDWLDRLDACQALATCRADAQSPAFTVEVTLDQDDAPALAAHSTLAAGTRLRVRVYNASHTRTLYFVIYRLAADRRIHLLTRSAAQGSCALPGQCGANCDPVLSWPEGLEARYGTRSEAIVVLASHEPLIGVHALVSSAARSAVRTMRSATTREAAVRTVRYPLLLRPPGA